MDSGFFYNEDEEGVMLEVPVFEPELVVTHCP